MSYAVARLDEIDGDQRWPLALPARSAPLRHHVVRCQRLDGPRGRRSDHQRARRGRRSSEELYFVLERPGRVRARRRAAWMRPPGRSSSSRPGVKRTAFAEEAGTTILALGGMPGKAYEPSGFGALGAARPRCTRQGEYAEAADRGRERGRGAPGVPRAALQPRLLREPRGPHGRRDRAPAAGHRAVRERSADVREWAKSDTDFDPIRDDPEFKELVGG